jgi:PAS domain S-box-containing protein
LKISHKLIVSYVLIGIIVSTVAFISIDFTKNTLVKSEGEKTINFSNEVGGNLINDIKYRVDEIKELSKNPTIIQEIKKSNSFYDSLHDIKSTIESRDEIWRNNFSEETNFINEVINNPASEALNQKLNFYLNEHENKIYAEIFVTNSYGVNVGETGKTSDYLQSDESWWITARNNGMHISSINYDQSSGVYSLDISQKITDDSGNFIGVIKAVYDSKEFLNILVKSNEHFVSEDIDIYLIDDKKNIIYTTSDHPFSALLLEGFTNNEYGLIDNDSRFVSISDKIKINSDTNTGLAIVIEQDPKKFFSSINSFIFLISVLSLVVTIGIVLLGLLISRSIVLPLRVLSKSSDDLASGILDRRISLDTADEFGELGIKFERMRVLLKSKNEGLQEELKKRSQRLQDYKSAIDKHSLVSITDKNGNIIYVNEKFCDVSKYKAEELIGKNHRILKSTHHPKEFYSGIWSVISKGGVWRGDIKNIAKDGSQYWVKSIIAPLLDDYGDIDEYIAIRTDITEQKRTEEQLSTALASLSHKSSELEKITNALDESAIVAITDNQGRIISVNDKFCEISKYSREELIGKNHRLLKSEFHSHEFFKKLWETISSGKVWTGDIKNKAKDGTYYWVKTSITPLLGHDGKPERYIAIRTDITKQKNTEEQLSISLEENKKVDKLKEEFMTMISHELKTPLTPITLWAGALKDENIMGKLSEEQLEAINTISNAADELTCLVGDIFDSYKLDLNQLKFSHKKIDVDELMNNVYEQSQKICEKKGVILENTSQKMDTMYGDEKRIIQILKNMVNNSVDFVSPNDGKIIINVSEKGDSLIFSVRDNGIGISEENQKHVFKKFYQVDTSTTREHGGSGLGLSICQGLVIGMGGNIWFESKIGEGTVFYFSLPKNKPQIESEFQKEYPNPKISMQNTLN